MICSTCHHCNEPEAPFCINCWAPLDSSGELPRWEDHGHGAGAIREPQAAALPVWDVEPEVNYCCDDVQSRALLKPYAYEPVGTIAAPGAPRPAIPVVRFGEQEITAELTAEDIMEHISLVRIAAPKHQAGVRKNVAAGFVARASVILILGAIVVAFGLLEGPRIRMLLEGFLQEPRQVKEQPGRADAAMHAASPATLDARDTATAGMAAGGPAAAAPVKNSILEQPLAPKIYRSQVFDMGDAVDYGGGTFSIVSTAKVYPWQVMGGKIKKGRVLVDVEVAVKGSARPRSFKVFILDAKGGKRGANTDAEDYLELPLPSGTQGVHSLWKTACAVPEGVTTFLHRGFTVPEEDASDFIVEIAHQGSGKVLWIKARHQVALE